MGHKKKDEPGDIFATAPAGPSLSRTSFVAYKSKKGDATLAVVECYGDLASPRDAAAAPTKIVKMLEEDLDKVAEVARTALASLKKIEPKELEIEFGVELGGQVGIPIITQGTAKANFKVKMKWVP